MTDQKLVDELEKALRDEVYDGGFGYIGDDQLTDYVRGLAVTAAGVIEKAHTPTDDEREALATVLGEPVRGTLALADRILAAGFRRSVVPEPSADESHPRGHWSNGDPVHIVTDGIDRWIAPNHNGATWIEDAS